MADEISVTTRLQVSNGGFSESRNPGRVTIDQAAQGGNASVQTIGTTYEALNVGDVTTEGLCHITNLDAANFVDIGTDGGAALVPFLRLLAGESALFRASTNALYALADTAPVKIDALILQA